MKMTRNWGILRKWMLILKVCFIEHYQYLFLLFCFDSAKLVSGLSGSFMNDVGSKVFFVLGIISLLRRGLRWNCSVIGWDANTILHILKKFKRYYMYKYT